MSVFNKSTLALGCLLIAPFIYSGVVTDAFRTGEVLTAEALEKLREAINDNNTRIDTNTESISTISLTPGPQGPPGEPGPQGTAGADGVDAQIPTYNIGDMGPAGGFVFFATDDRRHGFEAAPVDIGFAEWGCQAQSIQGARGIRLGSGEHNTEHIMSECGFDNIAADIADAYSHNGYIDWYLPSAEALEIMYSNLFFRGIGGFTPTTTYWSSTEARSATAYAATFDTIAINRFQSDKDTQRAVRPIRSF